MVMEGMLLHGMVMATCTCSKDMHAAVQRHWMLAQMLLMLS